MIGSNFHNSTNILQTDKILD